MLTSRFIPDEENPDDEPNVSTQSPAHDPTMWPLELGETLVVYHPHAKQPPQVIPTRELANISRSPEDSENLLPLDDSQPPHFPFRTLADFEQTELFIKRDNTDPQIDEQLNLWRRHAPGVAVTLKNAREMHQHLEAAGIEEDLSQVMLQSHMFSVSVSADHLNPKFEHAEIQVPYENKGATEMRKYNVRFRPALDAVKHVLEDPALRRHLIRYPERHYIRKPGTNENMRVWSDVHTADDWWELQVIQPIMSHRAN